MSSRVRCPNCGNILAWRRVVCPFCKKNISPEGWLSPSLKEGLDVHTNKDGWMLTWKIKFKSFKDLIKQIWPWG